MWFLYALISAFLASFRKVNDKQLTNKVNQLHIAWCVKLASIPIITIVAICTHSLVNPFNLPIDFWIPFLISVLIMSPLDTYMYLSSIKHGELSKIAPLHSLWPAVMLIFGAIFLGLTPSLLAIVAIFGIAYGVIAISSPRFSIIDMIKDKATRHGLIGIVTVSVNSTLGGLSIQASGPIFYALISTCVGCIIQFVIAKILVGNKDKPNFEQIKTFALTGNLNGLAYIFYSMAVASGPIAYVAAVRSSGSTISALFGIIFLKEQITLNKLFALFIIFSSSILLALTSTT